MVDEKKLLDKIGASIANRENAQSESSKLAIEKEAANQDPNKPIPLPTLSEAIAKSKDR